MNFRHTTLMFAAAAGTALGAPVAHADETAPLPPWGFTPPGIEGDRVNVGSGPFWDQYDSSYTITDDGRSDGNVLGSYDVHEFSYTALFLTDQSIGTTSSTGDAPPEGTVWDYSTFGFPTGFGAASPFLNHYTDGPDGTADWFQIAGLGFQNVFVSTADRTADYIGIGTTLIPIFDTAPDSSSMSAVADLFDPSTAVGAFDAFDAVSL